MSVHEDVMDTLRATSRTFFIPINHLPPGLKEAVASAYLCMRAVDEIEDHAELGKQVKIQQLRSISQLLQAQSDVDTFTRNEFSAAFSRQKDKLPTVTLRIAEWACEQLSRTHALHFGRGLQAVNILRNRPDDLARGVDFFPLGWTWEQMYQYAYRQLSSAEAYTRTLASDSTMYFIKIPLALAYATLDALKRGEAKLSREEVLQIIQDTNNN